MRVHSKAQPRPLESTAVDGTAVEGTACSARHDLRIGSILTAQGKLDTARIGQVLRLQQTRQGVRFGEAALSLGLITRDDLNMALARQFDFPHQHPGDGTVHADLVALRDAQHPSVEHLRALRTRLLIRWSGLRSEQRALAIVSPGSCEGRSFVAANLAVLFAQLGMSTLLVDADLRAPRQCRIFNVSDRMGLTSVLSGRAGGEVSVPAFGPLSVMPAGPLPPNPQELLLRPALASYLELASAQFEVVLVDTPPARDSADAQSVAFCAGSAVVLARTNYTRSDEAAALARDLAEAGVLVLGAVLSKF